MYHSRKYQRLQAEELYTIMGHLNLAHLVELFALK